MVDRGQAIHLRQDAEPNAKYEILYCAETHKPCKCGEGQPKDVDCEKPSRSDEYQTQIPFRENPINQPFDEQGIEEKHETAQNDEGNAQEMRTQERADSVNKPPKLCIYLQPQKCSPQERFNCNI